MASFDLYAPTLRRWEGGFVMDPDDPGGATNMGVTLGTFRVYFGTRQTVEDLKNITDGQWRIIMKAYWNRCKADDIRNQSVAELFVDWHINAGGRAIQKTQAAFGLKADGIVGPLTLGALNDPDSEKVFNRIKAARTSYYNRLVIENGSLKKFLRGWLNRVNSFHYHEDNGI